MLDFVCGLPRDGVDDASVDGDLLVEQASKMFFPSLSDFRPAFQDGCPVFALEESSSVCGWSEDGFGSVEEASDVDSIC